MSDCVTVGLWALGPCGGPDTPAMTTEISETAKISAYKADMVGWHLRGIPCLKHMRNRARSFDTGFLRIQFQAGVRFVVTVT